MCTLYTWILYEVTGDHNDISTARKGDETSYHNTYPHSLASSDCSGMKIEEVQITMGEKTNASRGKDYIWLSSRFTAGKTTYLPR